jgi:hypothetical protein
LITNGIIRGNGSNEKDKTLPSFSVFSPLSDEMKRAFFVSSFLQSIRNIMTPTVREDVLCIQGKHKQDITLEMTG